MTAGSPGHIFRGWAPVSWKSNAIVHEGEWYTTLDPSYYPDSSAPQIQNYWLQLPAGWRVASYSESVMQSVGYDPTDTSIHHWGTEYLAFEAPDDTARVYSTKDGSPVSRTSNCGVCEASSYLPSSSNIQRYYKCACSEYVTNNQVQTCPSTFKVKVLIKTNQFSLVREHLG